jgi:Ca2+/Na+ antiporter
VERADSGDPSEQFLAEIAAMRVGRAGRDSRLLQLGALLMPLGVVLGAVAWFLARNTDNALDQRDAIILALIGVALSVVGVGLFVRYSMAEFLRFWMARLVYEQGREGSRSRG